VVYNSHGRWWQELVTFKVHNHDFSSLLLPRLIPLLPIPIMTLYLLPRLPIRAAENIFCLVT